MKGFICYADSDDSWTYISKTPVGTVRCTCTFAGFLSHGDDVLCYVQLYIWDQLYCWWLGTVQTWLVTGRLRVVSCPDPTQFTQGEEVCMVSQVQIVWQATCSDQSNCRVTFIGKCRSENKYFSHPAQSDIMRFLIQQFVTIQQAQRFRLVTPHPFLIRGLSLGTRLVWGVLCTDEWI